MIQINKIYEILPPCGAGPFIFVFKGSSAILQSDVGALSDEW